MKEYDKLLKQDEEIRNNQNITYDELVKYQIKMASNYPYFPYQPQDWKKIHQETITTKGMEHLEILRSQITMGKATSEDIVIFIRLLELYVCSNPSHTRLRNYKKEHDFHFGTILKSNYYPDLRKEGLVIDNPFFDKEQFVDFMKWSTELIQRCWKVAKIEGITFGKRG